MDDAASADAAPRSIRRAVLRALVRTLLQAMPRARIAAAVVTVVATAVAAFVCALVVAPAFVAAAPPTAAARPSISMEIILEQGGPLTAPQEWSKLLAELGVTNVRIASGTAADQMGIERRGSAGGPSFRVTGRLKADNYLYLPGGRFGLRDSGRLRAWLDELGQHGAEAVTEARAAFGLLPSQMKRVNDDLQRPVDFSTRGLALADAVDKLGRRLDLPIKTDADAAGPLAAATIEDEMTGIASGTALAAMLRPAGLAFEPEQPRGGALQYRILKPAAGRDVWPIGSKPEQPARTVLPDYFEMINVEIEDTPASEALATLADRLKVPFLYDRNAMALYGIDLTKTKAAVPRKRLSYSQILQKVLLAGRMKPELRVDEAGKPLVWITSIKPVQ